MRPRAPVRARSRSSSPWPQYRPSVQIGEAGAASSGNASRPWTRSPTSPRTAAARPAAGATRASPPCSPSTATARTWHRPGTTPASAPTASPAWARPTWSCATSSARTTTCRSRWRSRRARRIPVLALVPADATIDAWAADLLDGLRRDDHPLRARRAAPGARRAADGARAGARRWRARPRRGLEPCGDLPRRPPAASSSLPYFVRGQKNPRRPSLRLRGTTWTWRCGTDWLTTLFVAVKTPAALASPPSPRPRGAACAR